MLKKDSNKSGHFQHSLIILLAILFIGCGGLKPTGAGKSGGLYEAFYTGESGMQYFVKPLEFKSEDSKNALFVDIVFRENEMKEDSALVNFSILTTSKINNGQDLLAMVNGSTVTFSYERLIFKEKLKKFYETRIGTKCSPKEIRSFLKDGIESVVLTSNDQSYVFYPTKKTTKSLLTISDRILF